MHPHPDGRHPADDVLLDGSAGCLVGRPGELARALDVRMDWFFTDPPEAVVGYRTSASDQTLSSIDEWLERLSQEAEFVHFRGRTD